MIHKTALITGTSSDIGKELALTLSRKGFNIGAHYYTKRRLLRLSKNESLAQVDS